MLLAGLTLLPALLAVFGRAAFWPGKTRAGTGKAGLWSRVATRIVRGPAVPLTIGVVVFGALAAAVTAYQPGGFGGSISAPPGTDSAAGTALLNKSLSPPGRRWRRSGHAGRVPRRGGRPGHGAAARPAPPG